MTDEARKMTESARAHRHAVNVYYVYLATLHSLYLVASLPDANERLEAQIRVRRGMRPTDTKEAVAEAAAMVLEAASKEREGEFQVVRSQALMAMCAAVEHLVKATVVDRAEEDLASAAALLARSKIKVPAHEVLASDGKELRFSVVDALLKSLGETEPLAYPRMVKLLREYCHSPYADVHKKEIGSLLEDAAQQRQFNEAFLVRNCLVHNGGRVSATLSHFTKELRGSAIALDNARTTTLMRSLRDFATSLDTFIKLGPI